MRSLAAFFMRGRLQAVAMIVLMSMLPLLSWVGASLLALITLRQGLRQGVLTAALSAAVLALAYGLLVAAPQLVLPLALELWLPTLILAWWLRRTVSLSSTLRLAAGMAGLAVCLMYLIYPDQHALWAPLLDQLRAMARAQSLPADDFVLAFGERVLPLMTGLLVLGFAVTVVVALLFARWLQALLYNPGGFQREFHALSLGRPLALLAAGLLLAALFYGYGLVHDLAFVVSAVFALQTLALVHVLVAARSGSRAWFIGLYLMLPLLFEVAVAIGVADAAFGWRRRFLAGPGGDGAA